MKLWQKLRNRQLGVDFRRQHPAGAFVLDFYCPALSLAIELDGGQHSQQRAIQRDAARTEWLAEHGIMMLRYWNSDVMQNLSGVLEHIAARVSELQHPRKMTPTRHAFALRASAGDLPLSGGGKERRGRT